MDSVAQQQRQQRQRQQQQQEQPERKKKKKTWRWTTWTSKRRPLKRSRTRLQPMSTPARRRRSSRPSASARRWSARHRGYPRAGCLGAAEGKTESCFCLEFLHPKSRTRTFEDKILTRRNQVSTRTFYDAKGRPDQRCQRCRRALSRAGCLPSHSNPFRINSSNGFRFLFPFFNHWPTTVPVNQDCESEIVTASFAAAPSSAQPTTPTGCAPPIPSLSTPLTLPTLPTPRHALAQRKL